MDSNDDRKKAGDEKVGYGRPPKKHQWRVGQSGNPRGRPKGVQNEKTVLQALLRRKIPVQHNGKRGKISFLEAMYLRFADEALRGDTKAASFLLARAEANGAKFEAPDLPKDTAKMTAEELLTELKNRNRW